MKKCRTCAHFERGVWAKELTKGPTEPQCGGHCEVLMQALKLDGNIDFAKEKIYIQDTFGCVFHKQEASNDEWIGAVYDGTFWYRVTDDGKTMFSKDGEHWVLCD